MSCAPLAPLLLAGALLARAPGAGAPAPPEKPQPTPPAPAIVVDRIAAVVGDDILLDSEIGKLVAVGFLERGPGEGDAAYRDRVLDGRIVDMLRERQLRKTTGFDPRPEELDARVAAIEARLAREKGIPASAVLAKAGATRDELVSWVRRGLALEVYVKERLTPGVKVSEADLKSYYETTFREAAQKRGLADVPAFEDVREEIREVVREVKLNAEIERWTAELRAQTRILIYRREGASSSP